MPYQSNDQLPDGVKNNLSAEGQTIWRTAFNSAHKSTGDEQKAVQAGWGAVKNAGFKKGADGKWTKAADDQKAHSFDAEIFSVGTWNGDKYTMDDLQNMVESFNSLSDSIKPPVKLGHDKSKINDGAPALGWVKGLKVAGNKLIATLTDVPSIVYEAIKKGLYKRISSEIYWNLKHSGKTFKRVLSAVALLGADIPAVKDLQDLQAFLSQQFQRESFDDLKAYSFDATLKADVISIKSNQTKEMKKMPDDLKVLSDKIDALTSTVDTLKEQNQQLEKDKKDAEKKYTDLKTDIDAKERQNMVDDIKTFCEDLVKKGSMLPAQRDVITGDDALKVYNEGAAVYITFDQFKKFADLSGKILEKDEKGVHDKDTGEITDAVKQFTDKVDEYVGKHDVTHEEAYIKCLKLYPKLAEAYAKGGD